MQHPSLEAIVAGGEDAHLARCEACRALAQVAGLAAPPPADDLEHLTTVDDRVYTEWSALPEAQGGMGQVFRARDRRLGRVVAIKQLKPGLPEGERAILVKRFEREAWLTARLQHPAIVGVHEAGRFANGEPFYAMPLLRGRPLGAEIAARAQLADRLGLLANLTTIAEAIAYAHEQGIVHRDIKPANILVGGFGETVVIDWGLAKDISEQGGTELPGAYRAAPVVDGLTQFGVGTAAYMPPEQARGDDPDPLVDVYALGATLYHLLAGAPPYADLPGAAIRRALADGTPPRPLRELAPDVPRELADITAHAMAFDRAARLPSARELARELRRYQTGQLLATRQYTLGELVRRWLRKHRTAVTIGAAATVALGAVAVFAFVRIGRERDRAEANARATARELHRAQGLVATRQAASPATRLDALVLAAGAVATELAADPGGEPPLEAMQGLTDALVAGPPAVPLAHAGAIKSFALAGDRLVGVDDTRALVAWDARTGAARLTVPSALPQPELVRISPDGARAVVCGFDPIAEVVVLASGAHASFTAPHDFAGCGWLADGRVIAASADGVSVRDPATLAETAHFALPAAPSVLATGARGSVAVVTADGGLWTWRGAGAPVQRATGAPAGTLAAFDRAGAVVYLAGGDRVVRAFALDGTAVGEPAPLPGAQIAALAPGALDDRLAIGAWDQDGGRRGELRATGRLVRALDGSVQALGTVRAGEPGWALVEQNGPIAIVDADTGGAVLPLAAHATAARAFATGGERVATASHDGAAYLWMLDAPGQWLGHSREIVAVAPRGDRVLTASRDGSVRIWRGGRETARSVGDRELAVAAWLDDTHAVAGDLGGALRVIDTATGQATFTRTLADPISALAVGTGPDATAARRAPRYAVGTLGGSLVLGEAAPIETGSAITALAATPGGGWLSAHADGTLRGWDATGAPTATLADPAPVDAPDDHEGAVALIPRADTILAVSPTGSTRTIDAATFAVRAAADARVVAVAATGALTAAASGAITFTPAGGAARELAGYRGSVVAAAIAPDGARVAVAGVDGKMRMWSTAAAGAPLVVAPADLGLATALAFSAADTVVVGYAGGGVREVALSPRAALARACAIATALGRAADTGAYCTPTSRR